MMHDIILPCVSLPHPQNSKQASKHARARKRSPHPNGFGGSTTPLIELHINLMRSTCILLSPVLLLSVVSHNLDPPSYLQWTLFGISSRCVEGRMCGELLSTPSSCDTESVLLPSTNYYYFHPQRYNHISPLQPSPNGRSVAVM